MPRKKKESETYFDPKIQVQVMSPFGLLQAQRPSTDIGKAERPERLVTAAASL